jgi:hypothetical protein
VLTVVMAVIVALVIAIVAKAQYERPVNSHTHLAATHSSDSGD